MVEFSVSLCLVFASFAIVNCVASQGKTYRVCNALNFDFISIFE